MKRTSLLTRLVCIPRQIIVWYYINPKNAGGGGQFYPPSPSNPLIFQKVCLLKRGCTLVLCDFYYYHKSHLSWKFHWNYSSRSKDMRNFSANISQFSWIFIDFLDFLTFLTFLTFGIFFTKKLVTSAYNRWCQHFLIFNILQTDFLTIYWY